MEPRRQQRRGRVRVSGAPAAPAAVVVALWAAVWGAGCAGAPEGGPPTDPHDPATRIHALLAGGGDPVLPLAGGDTVHLGEELQTFYRSRGYRPVWTEHEGFLPRGEALLATLHRSGKEGLDVAAYHRDAVHELIERANREDDQGLAVGDLLGNLDVLLTESFLRYTTDIARGTVDPGAEGVEWRIPREDPTDAAFLERLLEHDDLERALEELRPTVPYYHTLRDALARYDAVRERGGWRGVSPGPTLEEGSTGPRVRELRARLVQEGDPTETGLVRDAPDPGTFDARLARAVEHFQERHGQPADGAVGPATLAALDVPVEERLVALRLNLDRWRWLPRDLGRHYVLVNVAGFQLVVMRDDRPTLRMNVVVGQSGWKTPIFRDTLEHIVVNPYWNVPPSIARDEVIPAATRDPGYLSRNRYEVLGPGGGRVDPYRVDLTSDRYRIRQRPGPGNALGEVKFLFPNAMNIYLHDTPAEHLFAESRRAFSHGCIRVEKPRELARYLLEHATTRSPADYETLRASGGERWVPLDRKLPIYVLYFTAWVDEDGTVRFYDDVYGHDSAVKRVALGRLDPGAGIPLAPPPM